MTKLFLALLLLNSCARHVWTANDYAQYLSEYTGWTENDLFEAWGYPNSQFYFAPNAKEVSYTKEFDGPQNNQVPVYQEQVDYEAINQDDVGQNPNEGVYYCKTSFTIENGIVTNYTFSGDDCIAP